MYWGNDDALVREICLSQIPVLSGVGHTIDKNIIDEVSKYSAKTPTAAAQILIEEMRLIQDKLEYLKEDLDYLFTSFIEEKRDNLENILENINNNFSRNLEKFKFNLDKINSKILLSLPENILEK
jgi:exodeoxyribonuclease VII large subunit